MLTVSFSVSGQHESLSLSVPVQLIKFQELESPSSPVGRNSLTQRLGLPYVSHVCLCSELYYLPPWIWILSCPMQVHRVGGDTCTLLWCVTPVKSLKHQVREHGDWAHWIWTHRIPEAPVLGESNGTMVSRHMGCWSRDQVLACGVPTVLGLGTRGPGGHRVLKHQSWHADREAKCGRSFWPEVITGSWQQDGAPLTAVV